jgi:hypothetical protein
MPQDPLLIIAAAALAVAALSLLLSLWLLLRVRRLSRTAARAVSDADPSLEAAIAAQMERVARLESRAESLDEQGRGALQRMGVVRFNPFEDTGSNQSFALAMLDARADGVVISSLHSRQSTRIYLKPIRGGQSETALSDEEAEALRKAGAGSG